MNLPVDIYSVASVRCIDRAAIENAGIPGYTLMTRAGRAAVSVAMETYPQARRWQVVCGSGNNGGDGYVVARLAAEQGIGVSVIAATPPEKLAGDAAQAYRDFAAASGVIDTAGGALDESADLLFDALLGSGLERPVDGRFATLVNAMNGHGAPVIALDMPSGLHGDSGEILGVAVQADVTVTFVGLKSGLYLRSGPELCGQLHLAELEIPPSCRSEQAPVMRRIDTQHVREALRPRARASHKGDFGHLLIVGGGPGMPGAVRICGEAALRSGAGLVTIATHPSHSALIPVARPELMCHGVASADDLLPLVARASVIAAGPGLGRDKWSRTMLDLVIDSDLPVVADADALNLLADRPEKRGNWILTPHPGEAARLLGMPSAQVQADRRSALAAIAKKYAATVVLKGAGSLVSAGSAAPWLCTAGNPGMASPGMGDALTGIIAAFRAQGLDEESAAIVGVQVHAEAGDAAAQSGERGLLVSDLVDEIRSRVQG